MEGRVVYEPEGGVTVHPTRKGGCARGVVLCVFLAFTAFGLVPGMTPLLVFSLPLLLFYSLFLSDRKRKTVLLDPKEREIVHYKAGVVNFDQVAAVRLDTYEPLTTAASDQLRYHLLWCVDFLLHEQVEESLREIIHGDRTEPMTEDEESDLFYQYSRARLKGMRVLEIDREEDARRLARRVADMLDVPVLYFTGTRKMIRRPGETRRPIIDRIAEEGVSGGVKGWGPDMWEAATSSVKQEMGCVEVFAWFFFFPWMLLWHIARRMEEKRRLRPIVGLKVLKSRNRLVVKWRMRILSDAFFNVSIGALLIGFLVASLSPAFNLEGVITELDFVIGMLGGGLVFYGMQQVWLGLVPRNLVVDHTRIKYQSEPAIPLNELIDIRTDLKPRPSLVLVGDRNVVKIHMPVWKAARVRLEIETFLSGLVENISHARTLKREHPGEEV